MTELPFLSPEFPVQGLEGTLWRKVSIPLNNASSRQEGWHMPLIPVLGRHRIARATEKNYQKTKPTKQNKNPTMTFRVQETSQFVSTVKPQRSLQV